MIRSSKVKLGKTPKAEQLLVMLETCRQLYNACLQQRKEAWQKQQKSLTKYDQQIELKEARKELQELAVLDVQMMRETALYRLDKAFQGFFRRIKKGQTPGFPRFKSLDRFNTLNFTTQGWKIDGKKLLIRYGKGHKYISLRMRNQIHLQGEIKGLSLVRSADRWWAHFLVDVGPTPTTKPSTNGIGIDVGLKTFATCSDNYVIEHPRFLRKSLDVLKEASRELSKKKRSSNRRAVAKLKLAKLHERIRNRRKNFVHQEVAKLVKRYDSFAVEQLDVQKMMSSDADSKNKTLSRGIRRGIMDSGWAMFMTHLESKAEEAGFPVVRVNPRGTTQRCSGCGSLVRKTLKDRIHDCNACGLVAARPVETRTPPRDIPPGAFAFPSGWSRASSHRPRCSYRQAPAVRSR